MRAAVYTRISLDKTGEGAGVERQREDCTALVEGRGWYLAGTFEDNSISAAGKRSRPGFEALLSAVARRELDVVVAWAWDRLSRNRRDEVRLIEACKAHGVSVALVRGTGDLDMSSAVGRAVAEILATIGRMENEQRAERQRRALDQRAAKGLPWGPTPAFGYGSDRVSIVEAEGTLIRAAYGAVLRGASCRSIATAWNAAGVSTRTGGQWSGSAVRRVLMNPRYMGVRAVSTGKHRHGFREVGPAAWPGLVDEDTWRGVQAVLAHPSRTTTAVRVRVHLLSGLARCGHCGAPVRSYTHARGWPAYSCPTSRAIVRKASPCDDLVGAFVIARLSRPDARELLDDDDRPDVGELRGKAAALRARIEATRDEFVAGDLMTPGQLREVLSGLQARLAEVEQAMASPSRAPVLSGLVGVPDVAARWAALSVERRRAVIGVLMTVTILPTGRGPGFRPESIRIEPVL